MYKKLIVSICFILVSQASSAVEIFTKYAEEPLMNCGDGEMEIKWHRGGTFYPGFLFWGDARFDYIFGFNSSTIRVYDPGSNLKFHGDFSYMSNGKAKGVDKVLVAQIGGDGVSISNSSGKEGDIAQIAYLNNRKYSKVRKKTDVPEVLTWTLENGETGAVTLDEAPVWEPTMVSKWSCLNITIE